MSNLDIAKKNLLKEECLGEFATKSSDAIRIEKYEEDIRPNYFRDIDRIIHSLSYTRYLDKTQVFTMYENDHLSKRITHVQLVSKIARTIGRALKLNEDLCEAIALGHDIGHTPLGHTGEALLNEISLRELGEFFAHNIQSVRHLMVVENKGLGLNLSVQVYDGIMCHNGEMLDSKYVPMKKDKDEFLREYNSAYTDLKTSNKNRPMTLEGCVVRISDVIGYLGRDIEDAINLGVLDRNEIPENIKNVLGTTNKEIVNTIILDIISNSLDKPYIKMSDEVFKAVFDLKEFNYKNIYSKANTKEQLEEYRFGMNALFLEIMNDLTYNDENSDIYKIYLDYMSKEYKENTDQARIIIDYIAGMTDDFFKEKMKRK